MTVADDDEAVPDAKRSWSVEHLERLRDLIDAAAETDVTHEASEAIEIILRIPPSEVVTRLSELERSEAEALAREALINSPGRDRGRGMQGFLGLAVLAVVVALAVAWLARSGSTGTLHDVALVFIGVALPVAVWLVRRM